MSGLLEAQVGAENDVVTVVLANGTTLSARLVASPARVPDPKTQGSWWGWDNFGTPEFPVSPTFQPMSEGSGGSWLPSPLNPPDCQWERDESGILSYTGTDTLVVEISMVGQAFRATTAGGALLEIQWTKNGEAIGTLDYDNFSVLDINDPGTAGEPVIGHTFFCRGLFTVETGDTLEMVGSATATAYKLFTMNVSVVPLWIVEP